MGLSIIAKQAGIAVAGSDISEEFITDKVLADHNINVYIGFKKENIDDFFKGLPPQEAMVIATGAHSGFDNEEAVYATSLGYKVISHGEAVGLFMNGQIFDRHFEGISVSGSHGKTTIGGMIASCLVRLGSDPSFTVGTSEIFPIGAAGHFGQGKYFVAEADEYLSEMNFDRNPKFIYQHPKYLIINNIDFDHPDFFENIESVINAYKRFVANTGEDSLLIINGDDESIKKVIGERERARSLTYGTGDRNEFVIKNFKEEGFGSKFEVLRNGTLLGNFELAIPGYHNAKNSLAVIALLIEIGISIQDIQRVLPDFIGVKRRLERIGEINSLLIFDDYAHHPEEIRKTLEALRLAFPDKKVIVIFQAHTYARTQALLSEFASSFVGVFELIILPTFASARDTKEHGVLEDNEFVEKIRTIQANVKLIETKAGVVEYIRKNISGSDKIVVTMGAGDVYKIGYQLAENG